jgi:molybdopterin/thiamine biosynthesis adenylyltransferase
MSRSETLVDLATLRRKTVAIIGVGGLGTTAANLLARQGVQLILADGDIVEPTNIERQTLFNKEDIGRPKVHIARDKLKAFTPIQVIFESINENNIERLKHADIILDCTDSIETRLIIDDFSKEHSIPWVYSAGVKTIGALYFVDPSNTKRATFRDFAEGKEGESACEVGVLNSTVSTIASLSVNMVVRYLSDGTYEEKLLRVNLDDMSITKIAVKKK